MCEIRSHYLKEYNENLCKLDELIKFIKSYVINLNAIHSLNLEKVYIVGECSAWLINRICSFNNVDIFIKTNKCLKIADIKCTKFSNKIINIKFIPENKNFFDYYYVKSFCISINLFDFFDINSLECLCDFKNIEINVNNFYPLINRNNEVISILKNFNDKMLSILKYNNCEYCIKMEKFLFDIYHKWLEITYDCTKSKIYDNVNRRLMY